MGSVGIAEDIGADERTRPDGKPAEKYPAATFCRCRLLFANSHKANSLLDRKISARVNKPDHPQMHEYFDNIS